MLKTKGRSSRAKGEESASPLDKLRELTRRVLAVSKEEIDKRAEKKRRKKRRRLHT